MNRRKIMLLALAFVVAPILIFTQTQKKTVTIADEGQERSFVTYRQSVAGALDAARYDLDPRDRTVPEGSVKLKDGMHIEIRRAFPVFLKEGNAVREVKTAGPAVQDLLREEGLVLGEKDRIEPSLEAVLAPGDSVSLTRVREETIVRREKLSFGTVIRKNPDMGTGETVRLQIGVDGEKLVTYLVTYENNCKAGEEKIGETLFMEPTPEIIEKGAGQLIASSRGELRYVKAMEMVSTAYDLSVESCGKTPDDPEYGITRSGTQARRGVVAVDPKVIPLGSRLYVESLDGREDYGFAVAEDTGGAVKGNIIDLFMETEAEVAAYGKRRVRVYILE